MTLHSIAKAAERFAVDNSPAILTGIGVAGAVTTAYLTGRASFKAAQVITLRQALHDNDEKSHEFTARENAEFVWRLYIPAAAMGFLTVASIISANRIGSRRAAAVAAAYTLMERGFEEYREKMKEKLGSNKEQLARDEIAQARVNANPSESQMVIIGRGTVLCYEMFTGRYFYSDMESLRKAQNDINWQVNNTFYASLTDFYDLLGLPSTGISDDVGWNADRLMELKFSAVVQQDSGRPAIAFSYSVSPIRGYARLQ